MSAELRRRGVYPVTAAYAVVAFILLQIGEITFAPLGLPNWVMVTLIALVIVGFPVVIVLAWIFDLTPKGIRRDKGRAATSTECESRPSIAVLPFIDLSPEKDQSYFCEGIAEEILNALTKIRRLNVAARSSSFQYNAGAGDVRKIGEELGVRTILEGSVRKSDERLRVTAQLVKASDGYHIWSKTFNEEPKDIFAIQDDIASCIADALVETLTPSEQSAIKTTPSADVSAYDSYLRGRQFFKRFGKRDVEFAKQMFQQAIEIDPEFAPAWAGYADCYSFLVMYADPQESYPGKADAASKRALELGPEIAEAHASRGLALLVCKEFDAAEAEFKTAIEQNPQLFEAYYYYARTCFHQGRLDEAAELFRKAGEVDPTDYQSRCLRGQILRGMGRDAEAEAAASEAIAVIEKHLKWHPDDARAYHLGAGSLIILGDVERAKSWLMRAVEMDPDDSVVLYNVACNLSILGEADEALDYLGRAIQIGTVNVAWMRNDEDLANLRGYPRFAEMLEGLEQQDGCARLED